MPIATSRKLAGCCSVISSTVMRTRLPKGDYRLTLTELQKSHLVTGGTDSSNGWDKGWRNDLVEKFT